MNKKIATEVALGIIVVIAILLGLVIYYVDDYKQHPYHYSNYPLGNDDPGPVLLKVDRTEWPFSLDDPQMSYSLEKVGNAYMLNYKKNGKIGSIQISEDTTVPLENYLNKEVIVAGEFKNEARQVECFTTPCEPINTKLLHIESVKLKNQASPVVDATNWQTYRNEKYGYEIKFPKNWDSALAHPKAESVLLAKNPDNLSDGDSFMINVKPVEDMDVNKWAKTQCSACQSTISELNGRKVVRQTALDDSRNSARIIYNFISNNWGYSLTIFHATQSGVNIGEEMAKTFEFIGTNSDFSDWQTYRNDKYGFEFQYPGNWKIRELNKDVQILFFDEKNITAITNGGVLLVEISKADTNDLKKWVNDKFYGGAKILPEYKDIYIDNIPGIRFSDPELLGCGEKNIFSKNGYIFKVNRMDDTCNQPDNIYDQILSTFKFIN